MATKPLTTKSLSDNTVKILNAIRNQASANYKDYIPTLKDFSEVKEIGAIIMDYPALQNEFLNALINRIGLVVIKSKTYENPIAMFKKGFLEFGESIEEIFTNIATAYQFDPEDAETTLYKRYIPDVRSAFHMMNFQKFYPTTVSEQQLRQAFLSADGVYDLIGDITNSLYTAMNYDEFLVMKYVLAKRILDGQTYPVSVDTTDIKSVMEVVRKKSNDLTFMSKVYNPTAVYTHTPKEEQYLLISSEYDAKLDVEALAYAFNMNKIDVESHKVLIDGFGELDIERLNTLLAGTPNYTPLTQDDVDALNAIPCVLVDDGFFMVYDNLMEFKEKENSKGLYWNYFLHSWKTFSTSPFSNAVTFVPDIPLVNAVTVEPTELSITVGSVKPLSVDVDTVGYASKAVTYTTDTDGVVNVDIYGNVTALATGTTTITVTSVFDTTKSATCKVTVA